MSAPPLVESARRVRDAFEYATRVESTPTIATYAKAAAVEARDRAIARAGKVDPRLSRERFEADRRAYLAAVREIARGR